MFRHDISGMSMYAKEKPIKPYPHSVACGGYEMIYKCRKCNRVFKLATSDFHYCPRCGQRIDWGVIVTVNKEWRDSFITACAKLQETMLADIDKRNSDIPTDEKHGMLETKATKDAIVCSNIKYYLGIGWSKEQLVRENFFTEEQIKMYEEKEHR